MGIALGGALLGDAPDEAMDLASLLVSCSGFELRPPPLSLPDKTSDSEELKCDAALDSFAISPRLTRTGIAVCLFVPSPAA